MAFYAYILVIKVSLLSIPSNTNCWIERCIFSSAIRPIEPKTAPYQR